jgi:hypothetical protein
MVPAMRINGKPSNVGWGAISPTKWWRSTAATLGTTMRRVTLPMVTRTILFNLILSVIGAMQTFLAVLRDVRRWLRQHQPPVRPLPLQQGVRTEPHELRFGAGLDPAPDHSSA